MASGSFRVLWIHQNFVSARQPGNSRPIHILSALAQRGAIVDVITTRSGYLNSTSGSKDGKDRVEIDGQLKIHRLNIPSSPHKRSSSYMEFVRRAVACAKRVRGVDVVYSSSPPLPQVTAGLRMAVHHNAPLLLEIRDLWPANMIAAGLLRSRPMIAAMEALECTAYRFADHIIPVAPSYAPYLEAVGVPHHSMTVIPTGGDPIHMSSDDDEAAKWRHDLGAGGRFVLLYAGSMNEYYDFGLLLAAAERSQMACPEAMWVFAGDGRCREQIEEAALRLDNVRYVGALPKDKLLPLFRAADAGLVSLWNDPVLETMLPGKLFDCMAAALPVVCTVRGQAGAIVERAQCGTVVEPSTEALLSEITRMARMPQKERGVMGKRGCAWVLEHVNALTMGRNVADIIENVAIRGRRANRSRLSRVISLAGAAAAGTGDMLLRRPARAVRSVCHEQRQAAIDRALDDWLATRRSDPASVEYSMPGLLSSRSRRDS